MHETITLKVNGKSFTCRALGCKSKSFTETFQYALAGQSTLTYVCAFCTAIVDPNLGVIEAQLPPRNDWRTPGGSAMHPATDTSSAIALATNPSTLWDTLHAEYQFNLDVAADASNTKCPTFYDEKYNALVRPDGSPRQWYGADLLARIPDGLYGIHPSSERLREVTSPQNVRVWDNCPYQPKGTIELWLRKALEQAAAGVFSVHLIPMASSVEWFNELVVPFAEWHTFKGRIPFIDPTPPLDEHGEPESRTSPKQDNLLVIYDPESSIIGHTAVRDSKTGRKLWIRPGTRPA